MTITANGLELGTYTQKELGAQVEAEELADAAWRIGREEGALGWLKNGWAMLKGRLGGSTKVEAEVSAFDPAILRRTAQELAADWTPTSPSTTLPVSTSYRAALGSAFSSWARAWRSRSRAGSSSQGASTSPGSPSRYSSSSTSPSWSSRWPAAGLVAYRPSWRG